MCSFDKIDTTLRFNISAPPQTQGGNPGAKNKIFIYNRLFLDYFSDKLKYVEKVKLPQENVNNREIVKTANN